MIVKKNWTKCNTMTQYECILYMKRFSLPLCFPNFPSNVIQTRVLT